MVAQKERKFNQRIKAIDNLFNQKNMDPKQTPSPNVQNPPDYGKELLSWRAPEYEKQEKSRGWFITVSLIGAALVVGSIIMRNYLMIILIALFAIVIYILHKKEPLMLNIVVTNKGVKIGEKFYLYKDLDNFWIIYDPPIKTLNFKTSRNFFPEISIQIEDEDPVEIREILLSYLDEDEEKDEESTADKLTRILKI